MLLADYGLVLEARRLDSAPAEMGFCYRRNTTQKDLWRRERFELTPFRIAPTPVLFRPTMYSMYDSNRRVVWEASRCATE